MGQKFRLLGGGNEGGWEGSDGEEPGGGGHTEDLSGEECGFGCVDLAVLGGCPGRGVSGQLEVGLESGGGRLAGSPL